jgi:hypothetical protein
MKPDNHQSSLRGETNSVLLDYRFVRIDRLVVIKKE